MSYIVTFLDTMSFINTEKSIIGYKIGTIERLSTQVCPDLANLNRGRVLITLQIAQGVVTNLHRTNALQPKYAQYRTSQAFVLQIEALDPKTLQPQELLHTAHNFFYYPHKDYTFVYETGMYVYPDFYDPCETNEVSQGIHFYLDKHTAIHNAMDGLYNGSHILRRSNGSVYSKTDYQEFQEVQKTYYAPSGAILKIIQRQNGVYHGVIRQYYLPSSVANGQIIQQEHRFQQGQLVYPILYNDPSGTFRIEVYNPPKLDRLVFRVFQNSVWILEQPAKILGWNHELSSSRQMSKRRGVSQRPVDPKQDVSRLVYYKYRYDLVVEQLLCRWYLKTLKPLSTQRLERERLQ